MSDTRGFSLLELLVASAIFFSFMVGLTAIYSQSHRTYRRGQGRIELQQTARIAMETMIREIRLAGFDPSDAIVEQSTPAPVQEADFGRLTFIADIDGDGVTDRVTYRTQGAQLLRDVPSWTGSDFLTPVTGQLADGVSGLTFGYAGASSGLSAPVPNSSLDSIGLVSIDLLATYQAIDVQESFPLSMSVNIRNSD